MMLFITLLIILGAEFVNGWTDAPNAIATVVSTRALSLRGAILVAAILNTIGVLSGTAVATTIGKGIVDGSVIDLVTIVSAMASIIIWSTLAWKFGLPTSESHALIAGLSGAGLATAGPHVLLWSGWVKVLIGLIFSTFLGLGFSCIITYLVIRISRFLLPEQSKKIFRRLQVFSASFMAFSHGLNDGQKFMGVFALALLIGGFIDNFYIPVWVILLCAFAMGIGTSFGGWRIIRTMGIKMVKLQTFQGFSAETAAASAITLASHFGIPLSTTHTIGTAIIGSGVAYRKSSLNLGVVKNIVYAWILTFPFCSFIAFIITFILRHLT